MRALGISVIGRKFSAHASRSHLGLAALASSASAFAEVVVEATRDRALASSAFTVAVEANCALRSSGIHNTEDTLVAGLPNSLVTIGLVVRLNSGAGLVGVLTGIARGIPGGVTTGSTARWYFCCLPTFYSEKASSHHS